MIFKKSIVFFYRILMYYFKTKISYIRLLMFQRYETSTSGGRVPLGHMVTDDITELGIRLWTSNRSRMDFLLAIYFTGNFNWTISNCLCSFMSQYPSNYMIIHSSRYFSWWSQQNYSLCTYQAWGITSIWCTT